MKNRAEMLAKADELDGSEVGTVENDAAEILRDLAGSDDAGVMSEAEALDYLRLLENAQPEAVALVRRFLSSETAQDINESLSRVDQMLERIAETNPAVRRGRDRAKEINDLYTAQRESGGVPWDLDLTRYRANHRAVGDDGIADYYWHD